MNCRNARERLNAYFDGELPQAERDEVDVHLRECEHCARALAGLTRVSSAIQGQGRYLAPSSLVERLGAPAHRRPRGFTIGFATGLAVAYILFWAFTAVRANSLTAHLVAAHVHAIGAGPLIQVASSDRHTVKPWFLGKIDFAPSTPNLASSGFPLIGGRVDRIEGTTYAALVYRKQKHVITVFVAPRKGDADHELRGFSIRHWTGGDLGYWAVSDVEGADLDRFAAAFQVASR